MLEIKNLAVSYGNVRAVSDVSLRLDAGQLVSLIGANGAGKTTVLHTIMGMLRPAGGQILFDGRSINGAPPHRIVDNGIALAPEGRQLFPMMSIRENLEVGFDRRIGFRVDRALFRQRWDQICTYFPRLDERQHQAAGTLSGGEQQMVAIARALMGAPRILLLDEPSLGLSPVMIDTVVEIVETLHRSGLSMILVEQNAELALEISDYAYVMETGRTVLAGPSRQVLQDPKVRTLYLGAEDG